MTRKLINCSALVASAALAAACSSVPAPPAHYATVTEAPIQTYPSTTTPVEVHAGTVRSIEQMDASQRPSGGGALLGAVIGGVVGNQIGHGTGRAAATALGAVGGAVAGNRIEENRTAPDAYYHVTVAMDNGELRAFDYRDINGLRVGDRVRIVDNQLERW